MKERAIRPASVENPAAQSYPQESTPPVNRHTVESASLFNLLEYMQEAAMVIDGENKISGCNQAAEVFLGLRKEKILHRPFTSFFQLKQHDQGLFSFQKGQENGFLVQNCTVEGVGKKGNVGNGSATLVPLLGEDKTVVAYAILIRAGSGQDELQEMKAVYEAKYQEFFKYKEEFLVTVSHELKTPLTVLKWYMESMDLKPDEEFRALMKKRSMQQLEKLYTLIDELLDMAKLEDGKLELHPVVFDIDQLITECVDNMLLIFDQHPIIYEKKEIKDTALHADRIRIEQVLFNLLTNAVKYSPKKSPVYVYLQEETEAFVISVKDHGMGIPKQYQKNVFTKFFRVPEREGKITGMGIGLYVCSEIIKRHGGKIWLESKCENTCTFSFSIPKTF